MLSETRRVSCIGSNYLMWHNINLDFRTIRLHHMLHHRTLSEENNEPKDGKFFHRGRWLRRNTRNLEKLAAFVASDSGVVVSAVFNLGYREWSANFMYGATRFGGIKEVLMFTFDKGSLLSCLTLGYACYNGKLFFQKSSFSKKETSHEDGKLFQVRV